jgi:hypothetical protein
MALEHASSGEPIDVRPLGAQLAERKTTALFKARDLEVICRGQAVSDTVIGGIVRQRAPLWRPTHARQASDSRASNAA